MLSFSGQTVLRRYLPISVTIESRHALTICDMCGVLCVGVGRGGWDGIIGMLSSRPPWSLVMVIEVVTSCCRQVVDALGCYAQSLSSNNTV